MDLSKIIFGLALIGLTSCEKPEMDDFKVVDDTIEVVKTKRLTGKSMNDVEVIINVEGEQDLLEILEIDPPIHVYEALLIETLEDGSYEIFGSQVYHIDGNGWLSMSINKMDGSVEHIHTDNFKINK